MHHMAGTKKTLESNYSPIKIFFFNGSYSEQEAACVKILKHGDFSKNRAANKIYWLLFINLLCKFTCNLLCKLLYYSNLLFLLFGLLFSLLFPSPVSSPGLCLNIIQLKDLPGLPYIKSMPLYYSSSQYTIYLSYGTYLYLLLYTLFTGLLPTSSAECRILRAGILSTFIILEYIVSSPEQSWC